LTGGARDERRADGDQRDEHKKRGSAHVVLLLK
jgi:hypothetical protein